MVYTQNQIKLIQNKRPELRFQKIPTLDDLIIDFLKRFDVIVKPINEIEKNFYKINKKDFNKFISDEEYYKLIEIKDRQTNEWKEWSKWALDHADFERYRLTRIKENQLFNKKILEKLNSKEIKEEFKNILKDNNTFQLNKVNLFLLTLFVFILSIRFINLIFSENNIKFIDNNNQFNKPYIQKQNYE
tara:strand:- start:194 stop:757 length:564 start_codon:yes stop_codon:yes gene_type:complete